MNKCSAELCIITLCIVVIDTQAEVQVARAVIVTAAVVSVTRQLLLVAPAHQRGSNVMQVETVHIVELRTERSGLLVKCLTDILTGGRLIKAILVQTDNDILSVHLRPDRLIHSILLLPCLVIVIPVVNAIDSAESQTIQNTTQVSFQADIKHKGTHARLDIAGLQHVTIHSRLVGIVTAKQILAVNDIRTRLD